MIIIKVYDQIVNRNQTGVEFVDNIDQLDNVIDICIIATKADVRKSIVTTLLNKKIVNHLILEKVAFQSNNDFIDVISLIKQKNISCYVNCPMRVQPIYKKVQELLTLKSPTKFIYEYSDAFKISSSFVHILDLFCYLCNDYNISIENKFNNIIDSVKHKDCIDFNGTITVTNSNNHILVLKKGTNKFTEVLTVNNNEIDIYAREGGIESEEDTNRIGIVVFNKKQSYDIPFLWQSYLTAQYVKQIINKQDCGLPSLSQSFMVHKPMINCFNEYLSKSLGKKVTICPIT